jgi:type VI secretion system protein ImpF
MAELTPQDRLQPCLLDRLTDEQPGVSQESRDRRVVTLRQLRQAVLRDLAWLLNSSAHMTAEEAAEFPEAAASVINAGMPDLTGLTASSVETTDIERMIKEAIKRFEPRVLPTTLKVTAGTGATQHGHNTIFFEIKGDLWAQPTPEPLFLRTEVDLETGQCAIEERGHG